MSNWTDQEIARLKVLAQHPYRTLSDMNEVVAAFPVVAGALEEARREIQVLKRGQEDAMDDAHRQEQRAERAEAARAEAERDRDRNLGWMRYVREQRDYNAHLFEEAHKEMLRLGRIIEGAFESLKDFGSDLPTAASEAAKWIEQTKAGQEHADSVREAIQGILRDLRSWIASVARFDLQPETREAAYEYVKEIDTALDLDPVKDWPVWPSLSLAYDPDNKFKGVVVGRSWAHGLVEDGAVVEHIKRLETVADAAEEHLSNTFSPEKARRLRASLVALRSKVPMVEMPMTRKDTEDDLCREPLK